MSLLSASRRMGAAQRGLLSRSRAALGGGGHGGAEPKANGSFTTNNHEDEHQKKMWIGHNQFDRGTWHDWFPWEANKPNIPQLHPYMVQVEGLKTYQWCACGESKTQPWCDGFSHTTNGRGLVPIEFRPNKDGMYALCACKHSERKPLCNQTHIMVGVDHAHGQFCMMGFCLFFSAGVFWTWWQHK